MSRIKLLLTLMLALPAAGASAATDTDVDDAVAQAIASFEPFATPGDKRLRRMTIGVDWEPAGCAARSACSAQLGQTAGYLYHLLKRRGAQVVLSHAPGDQDSEIAGARSRRQSVLDAGKCDVAIFLRCPCPRRAMAKGPSNARGSGSDPAAKLQAELGDAWWIAPAGAEPSGAGNPTQTKTDAGLLEVFLPERPSAEADWQAARADALALSNALASLGGAADDARSAPEGDERRHHGRAGRIARDLFPEGTLPAERAQWLCDLVLRLTLTNPSLVYAQVTARADDSGVTLTGAASAPCVRDALQTALRAVGIANVTDELRILPDRDRLGDQLFGACRVPIALTHSRPDDLSGVQTELLFGEPVFLLDREGDYLLLQGGDGYWGWLRQEHVTTMNAEQFRDYLAADEGSAVVDIDTGGLRIPRGARVRTIGESRVRKRVLVPGGDAVLAPRRSIVAIPSDQAAAGERIRAGLDLLHTPYVFGGRSPWGLDCSGLITNVFARCGQPAARDANQQALEGVLTATAWFRDGLRPGDQVFFIDQSGKVYHTGIAITRTHVLHSAPPCVQISSLAAGDRLYDARLDRDFFIAKRP